MPKPVVPGPSRPGLSKAGLSKSTLRGSIVLALVGSVFGLTWMLSGSDSPAPLIQVQGAGPFDGSVSTGDVVLSGDFEPPQPFVLKRGQTLGQLLRELGLSGEEAYRATTALASKINLRKVRAGQSGLAYYASSGELSTVRMELHRRGRLTLDKEEGQWATSLREYVHSFREKSIQGQLDTFLFNDVERAGGVPAVAVAMSSVLQWDLDFNRDLRRGDRFQVLYEEELLDNRLDGVGKILAMVYENRGVKHEAFLYGDGTKEGYYDAEGRPLQKMFLKSPLPFMRVTSRFSHSRFHPVLKRNRPHYGVDLGAPRGTPVRVTATGTVSFAGRQGGAGKMVKVRHPNGFETLYLHLSGYAKGVRRGAKVRQGDVIGYVGSTGLSTGPHLDYRVKRNKRYLNPLKLENRPAEPISKSRMSHFLEVRDRLRLSMAEGPNPGSRPVSTGADSVQARTAR